MLAARTGNWSTIRTNAVVCTYSYCMVPVGPLGTRIRFTLFGVLHSACLHTATSEALPVVLKNINYEVVSA